jgi:hypothetical protein
VGDDGGGGGMLGAIMFAADGCGVGTSVTATTTIGAEVEIGNRGVGGEVGTLGVPVGPLDSRRVGGTEGGRRDGGTDGAAVTTTGCSSGAKVDTGRNDGTSVTTTTIGAEVDIGNCDMGAPDVGITGGTGSEGASVTTISAEVGTMVDGSGTPDGATDGRSVTRTEVGRMVGASVTIVCSGAEGETGSNGNGAVDGGSDEKKLVGSKDEISDGNIEGASDTPIGAEAGEAVPGAAVIGWSTGTGGGDAVIAGATIVGTVGVTFGDPGTGAEVGPSQSSTFTSTSKQPCSPSLQSRSV